LPMTRIIKSALILGATLVFLASPDFGVCSRPFGPPIGPSGPALAPSCPPSGCAPFTQPFFMRPCPPANQCRIFSFEGGGRGYYSGNSFRIIWNGGADIDFIRDLNFSQNTLVAEVYAALRLVPTLALTYTYMIPRIDDGNGVLPVNFAVGKTIFPAGTAVTVKSTTSLNRWEGEYFFVVGSNHRVGGLLLGELWVENLQMEGLDVRGLNQRDSQETQEFLMGAGGSGEYAPANGFFVKFKGAYTFLQKQNGWYFDCQGKFFPEFNCGAQMRLYLTGGYRYRSSEWLYNVDRKIQATTQGPYVELGVIF
jgi:hypothetical protein